jgi:hypothetical protein
MVNLHNHAKIEMKRLKEILIKFLTGSAKNQLLLITGMTVGLFIADLISHRGVISPEPDTMSYYQDGEGMFNGIFPFLRTPIYPFLYYGLVNWLGNFGVHALSLLQLGMLLLSEIVFYKTVRIITKKKWIACVATMIYGWRFKTIYFTMIILSESFAVSMTAIIIFFMICAIYKIRVWQSCLMTGVMMLIMLMYRPFFICLTPIVALLYGYCALRGGKKTRLAIAAGTVMVAATYLGYCAMFQSNYSVFTTSSVSDNNLRFSILQVDHSLPHEYEKQSDYLKYREENRRLLSQHKTELAEAKIAITSNCLFGTFKMFPKWNKFTNEEGSVFHPWFLVLFIITVWLAIDIARKYRKRDKIGGNARLCIFLFATAIFFTTMVGAEDDFTRILMPVYPAAVITVGLILDRIRELVDNWKIQGITKRADPL